MLNMIFPGLQDASWGYLNLNQVALDWVRAHHIRASEPNLLLVPAECASVIRAAHVERGIDVSYGGWLEDRRDIWRGSYLDKQRTYIHLGVDFNVPAGTQVAATHKARVVLIDSDVEEGGWGTRVVLRPHNPALPLLIYAHLDPDTKLRLADVVSPGTVFARVGKPPENGGWFPHLHVQCVTDEAALRDLDGYCDERDLFRWSRICPDPLRYVHASQTS